MVLAVTALVYIQELSTSALANENKTIDDKKNWIKTDFTFYFFDKRSHLMKANLAMTDIVFVSSWGIKIGPIYSSPEVSLNRRFIVYNGLYEPTKKRRYILRDNETGLETKLFDLHPYGGPSFDFSPNEEFLAILYSDDRAGTHGIAILNLQTNEEYRLPHPKNTTNIKDVDVYWHYWSKDSNVFYFGFWKQPKHPNVIAEYYKYDFSNK